MPQIHGIWANIDLMHITEETVSGMLHAAPSSNLNSKFLEVICIDLCAFLHTISSPTESVQILKTVLFVLFWNTVEFWCVTTDM